ncbi:hypothetical protein DL96DRAFT_1720519 [Flagelloscypha sp. PMI_526]|nr:hypothetical protein DL96DRAFT_1720519 [Flagelloscypha sp. PMI_526]
MSLPKGIPDNFTPFAIRLCTEFSASSNLESARTLSLVSQEVQLWTDPFLFRCICQHEFSTPYQLLDQMCSHYASPRLVRARSYVRAIGWKSPMMERNLPQYLATLPNISQLCMWVQTNYFTGGQTVYSSLRRLFSSASQTNSFNLPFWSTITHLHLYTVRTMVETFEQPLFGSMIQLSHLAIGTLDRYWKEEPDIAAAVECVRRAFPPSLRLCLLSLDIQVRPSNHAQLQELCDGKVDNRIVVCLPTKPTLQLNGLLVLNSRDHTTYLQWCVDQAESDTYWEKGEEIQAGRQSKNVEMDLLIEL